MKTIRNKIFETNSSSTHSISIVECEDTKKLVIDNVLHVINLEERVQSISNESFILTCKTVDEKAAALCAYIHNIELPEEVESLEYIKGVLGYTNIINSNVDFVHPPEYGDGLIENFSELYGIVEKVLDPKIKFIMTYENY